MRELSDLVNAWRALPPDSEAVLATVIGTEGSVYRRPGARMLLTREGWVAGSISGGCLESDLVASAFDRTAEGAAIVRYDASSPDDILLGFGLGCNGIVDVLMHRLGPDGGPLPHLERVLRERATCRLTTLFDEAERSVAYIADGVGEGRVSMTPVLTETLYPSPALAVFGAGHDAVPLVRMAKALGWHVTVVDGRPAYAYAERFPEADRVVLSPARQPVELEPGAAVVVMTHSFAHDASVLRWLLREERAYVGLLGPTHRTERIMGEIGLPVERLHAPIGLDLGADGPDEIALAIVAEIQAVRKGRSGGVLKGRRAPLHARTESSRLDLVSEPPACAVAG